MKSMKKLFSTMLALLLVFCSLSAGMTVLAAEETALAETPFSSFVVGGTKVDFTKYESYDILNYKKTSAKVEWKLNDGWSAEVSAFGDKRDTVKNGGSVQVKKGDSIFVDVSATRKDGKIKYYTVYIFNGKPRLEGGTIWMGRSEYWPSWSGLRGASKLVSITSSKKAVLGVKKGDSLGNCTLLPKKPGSAKVTVVVKVNGKKMTLSANYTVKKYPNALKELKVDGKKVDLKKNKFGAQVNVSKKKVKLDYKIAKGWKVKCSYFDFNSNKRVNVKSGGTLPANNWVVFQLTRGKDTFWYEIGITK